MATKNKSDLVTYTNLSPNKSSPRNHSIDRVTVHCYVGQVTAKQGCDYFATTSRNVSANYVVGKDGSIGLSVDEGDRSWCSSNRENDNRSITIEVACAQTSPYEVTQSAYAALLNLLTDICRRHGKTSLRWLGDKAKALAYNPATNEMVMTVHRWFSSTACPGDYLYSRHPAIAEAVTKRLSSGASGSDSSGANTSKKTEDKKIMLEFKTLQSGSSGDQVRTVQRLLRSMGYKGADGKSVLLLDGVFGSNTASAVRNFQKQNGLEADSIIGKKTWAKLTGGVAK